MKKKRGPKAKHKKGRLKGGLPFSEPAPSPGNINTDDDVGMDENDEHSDSKVESESPISPRERTRSSLSTDADLLSRDVSLKSGSGHVKVRLRSLKPLDAHHTHSDLQSETDTSQPKVNLPGQMLNIESKEDSAYSDGLTPDLHTASVKSGSIKIISSKGLDKYSNKQTNSVQLLGERGYISLDNEKNVGTLASQRTHGSETGSPFQESCYNMKDLKDALAVIKKVMKMDAAEPFNAPVDPVALGIPDYFDVIDSPMDFGTICNDLEHGRKYLNSVDVFKDVQLIWDNCNKYNNKGDYIIDLMKRVKKNFTKYWLAAGLYCEVPGVDEASQSEKGTRSSIVNVKSEDVELGNILSQLQLDMGASLYVVVLRQNTCIVVLGELNISFYSYNYQAKYLHRCIGRIEHQLLQLQLSGATDATNEDEIRQSHEEKLYAKGKISKYKKKRPGSNHHKSGCLCAVCVVRRQKREREGTTVIVGNVMATSDANTLFEPNLEFQGCSPVGNRDSEASSMSLSQSPEHHSIVDAEGTEHGEMDASEYHHRQLGRIGFQENVSEQRSMNGLSVIQPTLTQRDMQDDTDRPSQGQDNYRDHEVGFGSYKHNVQYEPGFSDYKRVEKQEESFGLPDEMQLYEDPLREENHSILLICKGIFSKQNGSIWNGPHSLAPQARVSSTQACPLYAAVSTWFRR